MNLGNFSLVIATLEIHKALEVSEIYNEVVNVSVI
jgi:hypothetical protein